MRQSTLNCPPSQITATTGMVALVWTILIAVLAVRGIAKLVYWLFFATIQPPGLQPVVMGQHLSAFAREEIASHASGSPTASSRLVSAEGAKQQPNVKPNPPSRASGCAQQAFQIPSGRQSPGYLVRAMFGSKGKPRLRKRDALRYMARSLLASGKAIPPPVRVRPHDLPASFLEPDCGVDSVVNGMQLPTEIMYMLKSCEAFGKSLTDPVYIELYKFVDTVKLSPGEKLFSLGDTDDSLYIVANGSVQVTVRDPTTRRDHILYTAGKGDSVSSMLSILDVIAQRESVYRTISAHALQEAVVVRLPAKAFERIFQKYPASMINIIQMIMIRLQRVTFMALYKYLGLTTPLIKQGRDEHRPPCCPTTHEPWSKVFDDIRHGRDELQPQSLSHSNSTGTLSNSSSSSSSSSCGGSVSESKPAVTTPLPVSSNPTRAEQQEDNVPPPALVCPTLLPAEAMPKGNMSRSQSVSNMSAPLSPISLSPPSLSPSGTPDPKERHAMEIVSRLLELPSASVLEGTGLTISRLTPNSNIIEQGEKNSPLLLVVSGALSVSVRSLDNNTDDLLHTAEPGDMVGALSILTGEPSFIAVKTPPLPPRAPAPTRVPQRAADKQHALCSYPAPGYISPQHAQYASVLTPTLSFGGNGTMRGPATSVVRPNPVTWNSANRANDSTPVPATSATAGTADPALATPHSEADEVVEVVKISRQLFEGIVQAFPQVYVTVARRFCELLSPFVRQVDFGLDWLHVNAGQSLYRQGDPSDAILIVLNGRVRSVVRRENSDKKEFLADFGRGEIVGELEVLTTSPRATSMHAVRDTELAKIPTGLFRMIQRQHPQVVAHFSRLLGKRLLGNYTSGVQSATAPKISRTNPKEGTAAATRNLATVAIIPASPDVPLSEFCRKLAAALQPIGPSLLLNANVVRNLVGETAFDAHEYRLVSWLGQQEEQHRIVLYEADSSMTSWTQRCIRQADCVLVVAFGGNDPTPSQLEQGLANMTSNRAQKELVLLHGLDVRAPARTAEWLNQRNWVNAHHHIRFENHASEPFWTEAQMNLDMARLARRLTGTSIGLVLGGGGARGLAHLGVLQVLEEAGIPIDVIGGTSIGSFIGGIYANECNAARTETRARRLSTDMGSLFQKLLDLTYPVTAMFSGRGFNRTIRGVFKEQQIEDLWLPYFCVTTDISTSKMRVHEDGSLWRYVRASMSLSGYLPPLCDPRDGHLLLDGGYVNNLPADLMMSTMGANRVIAIDVGAEDETALTDYGEELSGWWLLWKRWNPFAIQVKVPNMADIQSRLAYVSCVRQLEAVKKDPNCLYVRPPIDHYKTLQFHSMDEIQKVGYQHAKALIEEWRASGLVQQLLRGQDPQLYELANATSTTSRSIPNLRSPDGLASGHHTPPWIAISDTE
ncbi:neuropathy target esterase, variant 1 [Capsaspora owczarzaki ATCC 30864]|nr:neuropathy target esterase, variant 1 [Capsaspora owczarzaki ATCC 30864]